MSFADKGISLAALGWGPRIGHVTLSSNGVTVFPQVVDRGGIDPPTFRFSGGRSSD